MNTVVHVNDKIRIAGGVEVYVAQLQQLLRDRDWSTMWLGITREGREVRIDSADGSLSWQGMLSDMRLSPLRDVLQQSGTVIHAHSLSEPAVMRGLLQLAPVVRTMHEPRIFCPGQGKFWHRSESICDVPFGAHCLLHAYSEKCCNRHPKRLLRAFNNVRFEIGYAAHRYAAIIAGSHYIADQAGKAGVACRRLEILPYFTPIANCSRPDHPARIVFAGRLSRTKGVHFLIESLVIVKRTLPNVRLDLLGDGIDRPEFENQVQRLGLQDHVQFHRWADRQQVDDWIARATVVAFPSIYPETFGLSGIEAMARGKPVVGFDVGGVEDWLQDGVTGFLVKAKDTEAYADALIRLLCDQKLNQRFGTAARQIALEKFSPGPHLDRLTGIYERAIREFPR